MPVEAFTVATLRPPAKEDRNLTLVRRTALGRVLHAVTAAFLVSATQMTIRHMRWTYDQNATPYI
jgi:hypothetical protein